MILSLTNIILCLAFILFAYFNLNDNDAPLWVSIYLLAAVCCGLGGFRIYYPTASITLAAIYVGYAAILYFAKDGVHDWLFKYNRPNIAQSMQVTKPYIEKTREFFGLLIASGAFLLNYFGGK